MFELNTFTVLWILGFIGVIVGNIVFHKLGIRNEYEPLEDLFDSHYLGHPTCDCWECAPWDWDKDEMKTD